MKCLFIYITNFFPPPFFGRYFSLFVHAPGPWFQPGYSPFFSAAGHAGESAAAAASSCASDLSPTHEAQEIPSNSSGRIFIPS